MTVSLVGIIVVQLFWISNAIDVKEAEYEENIREALDNIINKIERKRAAVFISKNLETITIKRIDDQDVNNEQFIEYFQDDTIFHINPNDIVVNGKNLDLKVDTNTKDHIKVLKKRISTTTKSSINYKQKGSNIIVIDDNAENKDSVHVTTQLYYNVFDDMVNEYESRSNPVEKQLNLKNLNELIKQEVQEKGIDDTFEYAIINSLNDTIYKQSENFEKQLLEQTFKASIFPNALVNKSIFLHLYLPGKNSFIYKSIAGMLIASVFFTLVIILIFFFTIRIAFRQKKLSEIKSDFINNMTHEFKTPIATISLAADSIKNPKIISNKQKITHFVDIIKEENKRMNNQVESVLQISLLEKEKFKVNLMEFDLHDLIQNAIKNAQIQIQQKQGKLNVKFDAENPFVLVDETHFLNVIHNLIDNALKYSKNNTEISIHTKNQNGNFIVEIIDNGIGIKKEDAVRIFDKFYRVSTGNIHNVKGFGLGLSYVKAIVSEFKGDIIVQSEIGKGSKFSIVLPVKTVENGK